MDRTSGPQGSPAAEPRGKPGCVDAPALSRGSRPTASGAVFVPGDPLSGAVRPAAGTVVA